eukprot:Em0036g19a
MLATQCIETSTGRKTGSWRSCSSSVIWCEEATSIKDRIRSHSNSSETVTRLHENADASTGVLEVVDCNSESLYLNEDDDVFTDELIAEVKPRKKRKKFHIVHRVTTEDHKLCYGSSAIQPSRTPRNSSLISSSLNSLTSVPLICNYNLNNKELHIVQEKPVHDICTESYYGSSCSR